MELAAGTCGAQPGERVVHGRRMMQASSDRLLVWSGTIHGGHDYWRQFHDMKGSADGAAMDAQRLAHYGEVCGWTIAHAHARSGDAISIAAYLGSGKAFPPSPHRVRCRLPSQNEADYDAFRGAIDDGRIEAHEP